MSKPISIFIISLLLIGTIGFGGLQYQKANLVTEENVELTEVNGVLKNHLNEAEGVIVDLKEENNMLQKRIKVLRDSVSAYESEIYKLKKDNRSKDKKIKAQQSEMKGLRDKFFALEQKITNLKNESIHKEALIKKLEEEKIALQLKNDAIYKETVTMQQTIATTEEDIVRMEMEKVRQETLIDILQNTSIYFDDITIKKSADGPKQNKIKKDGRAWNYTILDLTFQHDDIRSLVEEEFVLKMVDIDNQSQLSFVESNPAFPASSQDSKGLKFQYTGEKMQLVFHNNEVKKGKNYGLQLYYIKDGEEHRLYNGYQQFIVNGKVIR